MKRRLRSGMSAGLLALAACVALHSPYSLAARDAQTILKETCQGCHTPEADNALSRISHQRKTPEGWLMSIARMQTMHGLQISDDDRRTLRVRRSSSLICKPCMVCIRAMLISQPSGVLRWWLMRLRALSASGV